MGAQTRRIAAGRRRPLSRTPYLRKLPRLDNIVLPLFQVELWERILVADTDLSGMVYYDRYYRRAEAGYLELVRAAGASVRELFEERFVTPAASSRCDYFAPVRVDDNIRQVAFFTQSGVSSQTTQHHFLNEEGVQVASVEVVRVVVDVETQQKVSLARVLEETPKSNLARVIRAATSG